MQIDLKRKSTPAQKVHSGPPALIGIKNRDPDERIKVRIEGQPAVTLRPGAVWVSTGTKLVLKRIRTKPDVAEARIPIETAS